MNERQADELSRVPMGLAAEVRRRLNKAGTEYADDLLDQYDERVAIIAEGREVTDEFLTAAWESTLHIQRENRRAIKG